MRTITRFFQLVAVVFAGLAIYLAVIRLPQHVNLKVLDAQKVAAIEKEKLGREVADLRSARNQNDREVVLAKQSAADSGSAKVKVEERKSFLETQFSNLQTLIKTMETDQSNMTLREGVLRDEVKKVQALYSNTEADRRVMAVAMGRQTEVNNRLAAENGALKSALVTLNGPQKLPPAQPQVARVSVVPTFARPVPPVVAQPPLATPRVPAVPRGALGNALGYQSSIQSPSQSAATGFSGSVMNFNNTRGEVYVDIGKNKGVNEGSVLLIQRGTRTIGNAEVTTAFGESAMGRMEGDGRPSVGDKVVKIR